MAQLWRDNALVRKPRVTAAPVIAATIDALGLRPSASGWCAGSARHAANSRVAIRCATRYCRSVMQLHDAAVDGIGPNKTAPPCRIEWRQSE
jgi:hypothetical protein